MGRTGKRDPVTHELIFEEDDTLRDSSEYFRPKEDPEIEIAKSVTYGKLGGAVCPKCEKPLSQRMTAMGPRWVCGC